MRVTRFIVAVAFANAVVYHRPLFAFAAANVDSSSPSGAITLATLFFLLVFATALIFSLLALVSERLVRPLCMVFALCNALDLYFIDTYGVVLDETMMGNVLNTNPAEASEFFHPMLFLYLVLFGALPCWLLSRFPVQRERFRVRAALAFVVLLIGVGCIYASSTTWLWFDKNSSTVGGLTLPWSYVIGSGDFRPQSLACPGRCFLRRAFSPTTGRSSFW